MEDLIRPSLTPEDHAALLAIPTEDDIRSMVFQIGAHKAPGPDSMTGLFFQHYWKVVKVELVQMINQFFTSGLMLKEINHSFILLPKKENPVEVTDFRPICLSIVAYKVIAKLSVARLRSIMPKLISCSQAAFVPGRSIQENSVLAHKLFNSMKHESGRKRVMALKLDMLKAYDRLERSFIFKISQCVFTVTYSVLLNESAF